MKTILILLLFSIACNGQKGISYSSVDFTSLFTNKYEKIIGIKWVDFNDCSQPGLYYVIKYDYGETPPEYMELVRSYFTKGFPDTIRGWEVKDSLIFET